MASGLCLEYLGDVIKFRRVQAALALVDKGMGWIRLTLRWMLRGLIPRDVRNTEVSWKDRPDRPRGLTFHNSCYVN